MKWVLVVLTIVALGGITFGLWGTKTQAGRRAFDEMDGLYPFFALIGSVGVLAVIAIIVAVRFWMGSGSEA